MMPSQSCGEQLIIAGADSCFLPTLLQLASSQIRCVAFCKSLHRAMMSVPELPVVGSFPAGTCGVISVGLSVCVFTKFCLFTLKASGDMRASLAPNGSRPTKGSMRCDTEKCSTTTMHARITGTKTVITTTTRTVSFTLTSRPVRDPITIKWQIVKSVQIRARPTPSSRVAELGKLLFGYGDRLFPSGASTTRAEGVCGLLPVEGNPLICCGGSPLLLTLAFVENAFLSATVGVVSLPVAVVRWDDLA
eukprot:1175672-Prorocentrum_minimum.AAC.2